MERRICGARVTVTSVRAFLFLTESRTEATEASRARKEWWEDGAMELWTAGHRDLRASFSPPERISHGGHGGIEGAEGVVGGWSDGVVERGSP